MNQIKDIISKFLNIEIIGVECLAPKVIAFDLYDFLDKPGNFEHDVKLAKKEIEKTFPNRKVELKFYNDSYWNGEEMAETYNCMLGVIREE